MSTLVLGTPPPELEALLERRRQAGVDRLDEVWQGVRHMVPGPSLEHARISTQLALLLDAPARAAGLLLAMSEFNLGESEHDFRVPDGGLHRPGAAGVWQATAAAVVEILSPGDESRLTQWRARPGCCSRWSGAVGKVAPRYGPRVVETPPEIAGVIAELTQRGEAMFAANGAADGVLCFNRLYLRMTMAIGAAAGQAGFFADPVGVASLDPIFARLYFDAIDADAAARAPSRSWAALLAARARPGTASLQFALAGMNAHINHDLVAALLTGWGQSGDRPPRDSDAYADFNKVNELVRVELEAEKAELATGVIKQIDTLAGPIDSAVAMWSIEAAREHAWTTAEGLWDVRDHPVALGAALAALDRIVAVVGDSLLQPVV